MVRPMTAPSPASTSAAAAVAAALRAHTGPIVVVAHPDPDGDALGSVLTLGRALRRLGKTVSCAMPTLPRYLRFLAEEGELSEPMVELPEDALLAVVDTDTARVDGAPVPIGGVGVVNVDHHGTNRGGAQLSWVDPSYATATMMVAEVVEALGLSWDAKLATPCMAGLMTDTGTFRYSNTDRRAFERAALLMDAGVDYGFLSDRLQWRHPAYFKMLGAVMNTVRYHFGGRAVLIDLTLAMRAAVGDDQDDSEDFVSLVRYAEGVQLAACLRERAGGVVKLSLRSRGGVSAQRVCVALGGGGHPSAAGATLHGTTMAEAEAALLAAIEAELALQG